jgi:putative hydrolase of the HAD superfamily
MFYLSNMPAPYADHLERSHDFLRLFEAGIFSAREREIKPEAAIYALAEQRFGQPPGELLFIDDLLPNIMAAQARGWQGIHFESPAQCEADLKKLGAL